MFNLNWFSGIQPWGFSETDKQEALREVQEGKPAVRHDSGEKPAEENPEPCITPAHDPAKQSSAGGKSTVGREDDLKDAAMSVAVKLHDIRTSLTQLCRDTDPLFVRIARELRQVSSETKHLADSILETTHMVSDEKSESGILDQTGDLIQQILDSLTYGRSSLENSVDSVRELVGRILNFHSVIEQIDTISSRLRVVRINIRIQCSSRMISEDMFKSMTDDINLLSRKLSSITAQVKKDLSVAVRKLTALEHSVAKNLQQFATISLEAKKIVSQAFKDIQRLMNGAIIMIEEAGNRSQVISEKVDDVVVSIQFHDSLNQRVEHILQALDDVGGLLDPSREGIQPQHLGSARYILDLQHRQLSRIVHEVGAVKHRIQKAFRVMEQEVSGLNAVDYDSRLEAIGPQQFLSTLFISLQDELMKLCILLSSSSGILEQMRTSAIETRTVAENLQEMMKDIRELREDTRLNAANTIIMASNLGEQGSTIYVLAREISSLSSQTGEVADKAEIIQSEMNRKVTDLLETSSEKGDSIKSGQVDAITQSIRGECREVEQRITEVSRGIKDTGRHIDEVNRALSFLEDLQDRLENVTAQVGSVRDLLDTWRGFTGESSGEMDKLIERYTMELEREVHGFRLADEKEGKQSDEDILF